MRLDKNICLGGRLNNKDILGIRFNGCNIYQYNDRIYKPREFTDKTNLIEVDTLVTKIHADLSFMFKGCSSLTTIHGINEWDTSNVIELNHMFYQCYALNSLNLSNFDTRKVTDMQSMFYDCYKLTSLDLSNFNTSNVIYMQNMFAKCIELEELDLSSFNTGNVTDMNDMFWNCKALKTLDLSNFNTSNVTDMSGMFWNCTSLTSLDLSSWDTGKVTDMSDMFHNCENLTELDLSNFDASNVINMDNMLNGCNSLVNFQAPKNIRADFNVSLTPNLSHDSLMSIVNNLATVTVKTTLTLRSIYSNGMIGGLTDDEIAIATNKGWTVSHY